jgi:hypothetical protein
VTSEGSVTRPHRSRWLRASSTPYRDSRMHWVPEGCDRPPPMSSQEPPQRSNPERDAIVGELHEFLNDAAGTLGAAFFGVSLMRDRLLPMTVDAHPEAQLILGLGDPNDAEAIGYQRWLLASIPERLAKGEPVERAFGQQWIVLVHTGWEHNFRPRLARADAVEVNEVRDDAMSDIRLMRNDVVHHHGVASANNSGKCRILRWADNGDPIVVSKRRVAEFMSHFGLVAHPGPGHAEPRA